MGIQIAVDGHAGSGKQTLGKRLAEKLGVLYLDTGLLYRAVTLCLLRTEGDINNVTHCQQACAAFLANTRRLLEDQELRSPRVDAQVSIVAAYPVIRNMLFAYQLSISLEDYGVVMDGRDIGTSIMPKADVKFFVTADPRERARRRMLQYPGTHLDFDGVLANILERDKTDTERTESPLLRAKDAHLIDTTCLSADQVHIEVLDIVANKLVKLLRGY